MNIEWRVKVRKRREYSGDGAKEEGGDGRSLIGKRRDGGSYIPLPKMGDERRG